MERSSTPTRVLVAGATGYVGRRLVGELVAAGCMARCFARTPAKLDDESWRDQVQIVTGDVLDVESLLVAMHGVQVAYYLVHSIGSDPNWQERDRRAAENFRDAAAAAGVEHIIYLGGLGDSSTALSPHLRSRHEVGETLRSGPVPVTELRAAVVIGSGSAPDAGASVRPSHRRHRNQLRPRGAGRQRWRAAQAARIPPDATLPSAMNLEHPAVCPDPVRPPVMAQRWADLAYLHWTVDETEVRTYVRDESGQPACGSIPSTGAPHVMWSPGVDVAIGTLSSAVLV